MRAAIALLPALAWGAIDGDPCLPYPGHGDAWRADAWLDTTNDGVISCNHHDDGLTFQLRGGARIRDTVLSATLSAGTDKAACTRRDELTLVAGPRLLDGWVYVCPGARFAGNLGGGWVQDRAHGWTRESPSFCSYGGSGIQAVPMLVLVCAPVQRWAPHIVASLSPDWWDVDWGMTYNPNQNLRLEAGWVTICGDHGSPLDGQLAAQRQGWHAGFSVRLGHAGYGLELGEREALGRLGFVF